MARGRDQLLQVERVVAEGGLGLGACRGRRCGQLLATVDALHAATAAARHRLDEYGIADLICGLGEGCGILQRRRRARHHRQAELGRSLLGADLVAHQRDVRRARPDEDEAVLLHDRREVGALGEEAVTGVDRVGVGDLARSDDRRDVEVALARRRRADADRFVREPGVHRLGIRRGVDGDGLDAELPAGADDPDRDLPPVGDQDLVEHRPHSRISSTSPYSTRAPFSARIRVTRPPLGARTGFMVFIASTIKSVSPSLISSPTLTKGGPPGSDAT